MRTSDRPRTRTFVIAGVIVIAIAAVVAAVLATTGSSPVTPLSPAASVIGADYAKSIGFPKTVQAAKKSVTTQEKGCSTTVEAVYEDAADKTGLVSDVLECKTTASATSALAAVRRQITVDRSLSPPKALGSSAFATATNAPEYLMVWQSDTRVAITAIDVDVTATSSTPSTATPLTTAQIQTLGQAALHQDSLYH
jgi:hypothetical protein